MEKQLWSVCSIGTNHTRTHKCAEVLFHFTTEKYSVSIKNHFQHPFHLVIFMTKKKKRKKNKAKNQTKKPNSPSTDCHSSKVNIRKYVYDWIAFSSTQQSINDTLILIRMEISNAWWSAKKLYGTYYAFSPSVSPGRNSSVELHAQTLILRDILVKGGEAENFMPRTRRNVCHS